MNNIEETIQHLEKLRRQVQVLYVIYTLGFVFAFALIFRFRVAAIIIAVCTAVFYVFVRSASKRYSNEFNAAILYYGMCANMSDVSIGDKNIFSSSEFASWEFLPIADTKKSLLCRQGFCGNWKQHYIRGAEATFHLTTPSTDGKRQNYQFISGTLLRFKQDTADPSLSENRYTIISNRLLDPAALEEFCAENSLNVKPVKTGQNEQEFFVLFRPEETPPDMLVKQIEAFSKKIVGLWALQVTANSSTFFIKNRFYTQKITPKTKPEKSLLQFHPLPEISSLMKFANRNK